MNRNKTITGMVSYTGSAALTSDLINILGNLEEIETSPCLTCDKTGYVARAIEKNFGDTEIERYQHKVCGECMYNNPLIIKRLEEFKGDLAPSGWSILDDKHQISEDWQHARMRRVSY